MNCRKQLIQAVEEAERELDAARGRTALNAAAQKLQQARAELKRLDAEEADAEQEQIADWGCQWRRGR